MQRYLRLMLLCGIGMMILVNLSAQNKLVQGTVFDGDTDEPLLFATVETISGSDQVIGTTTDDNGFFRLEVPPKAVLLVSYIGYKPVEIRVRDVEEAVVIRMEA
ncbi:MAG: carboxypeptidase-like regulatory domain-containing protein, partial [Bacteroidota bacterium]